MINPIINLVLIKRFDTIEPSFFDDTVHSVEYVLKLAGFKTFVSCNVVDPSALNIIFGANAHFSPPLAQILEIAKPKYSVIFNMEQIALGNSFVTTEYLEFLSMYRVLDYNFKNIEAMRAFYPDLTCHEFPVIPSPLMASDFEVSEGIAAADVVFWGASSERRLSVLNSIRNGRRSVRFISNAYGRYLSKEIYSSKICLNIHALQTGIFEIARCLRPLAMGIPVVSEISHLPKCVDWSQSGIVFCEYNSISDECLDLLDNPDMVNQAVRKTQHFIYKYEYIDIAKIIILDLVA